MFPGSGAGGSINSAPRGKDIPPESVIYILCHGLHTVPLQEFNLIERRHNEQRRQMPCSAQAGCR